MSIEASRVGPRPSPQIVQRLGSPQPCEGGVAQVLGSSDPSALYQPDRLVQLLGGCGEVQDELAGVLVRLDGLHLGDVRDRRLGSYPVGGDVLDLWSDGGTEADSIPAVFADEGLPRSTQRQLRTEEGPWERWGSRGPRWPPSVTLRGREPHVRRCGKGEGEHQHCPKHDAHDAQHDDPDPSLPFGSTGDAPHGGASPDQGEYVPPSTNQLSAPRDT